MNVLDIFVISWCVILQNAPKVEFNMTNHYNYSFFVAHSVHSLSSAHSQENLVTNTVFHQKCEHYQSLRLYLVFLLVLVTIQFHYASALELADTLCYKYEIHSNPINHTRVSPGSRWPWLFRMCVCVCVCVWLCVWYYCIYGLPDIFILIHSMGVSCECDAAPCRNWYFAVVVNSSFNV